MIKDFSLRALAAPRRRQRSGAVTILFATAIVPLTLCVGLAVDYGFYIQALAQTTMAADAAAIHAVRIAVTTFNAGATATSAGATGGNAGVQWFKAQLGTLVTGSAPYNDVTVAPASGTANCPQAPCVGYDQSTGTFSTQITYTVIVPTHFGGIIGVPTWTSQFVASASETANAFVEVDMILDTSASMSIGTTPQDMFKIEQLSVCMPTAIATDYLSTGSQANVFQYYYKGNIGYAPNTGIPPVPTLASTAGNCDTRFSGTAQNSAMLCTPTALLIPQGTTVPGAQNVNKYGFCPPGYGVPDDTAHQGTKITNPITDPGNNNAVANFPVPTCALSCHDQANSTATNPTDLYGLVGAANLAGASPPISIRLDVVTQAAASVIQTLITKEAQLGLPNQFSVGVYEINSTTGQQDYPVPGGPFVEAGTNLQYAQTITANIKPTANSTDIDDGLKAFASVATPSGTGGTAATPRKNIFLVTDGLQDNLHGGPAGTRWTTVTPANCTTLKNMGFNIFVLYTPYYALPHYQYLDSIMPLAEPLNNSPITAALTACATNPQQFFQAASQTDINNAMATMLNLALNQPATITH